MLLAKAFHKEKKRNDIVARMCAEQKNKGCSAEAARLVEREFRKHKISESKAISIAEDLQYCNSIKELKARFFVNEKPEEFSRIDRSRLDPIFGAIYGDIIGSKYEGKKIIDISSAELDPMQAACRPTDDSVLTIATLKAARYAKKTAYSDREIVLGDINRRSMYPVERNVYARSYKDMARRIPDAGYGSGFLMWIKEDDERPYGSLGNGSAMRVSPIGAMYEDIGDVIEQAALSAMATHNHVEGVKGAVVTAVCIWMARNGYSKRQIYKYMKKHYSYGDSSHIYTDFSYREAFHRTINQVECSYSVPAAVISFVASNSYMDAIRLSAYVGLDTDTNACICGGIAGAYYGVPDIAKNVATKKLNELFGCDMLMNEKLGDTIRKIRIQKGYSVKSAARKTGFDSDKYTKIERGSVNISLDVMSRITDAFKIETEDIINGIGEQI